MFEGTSRFEDTVKVVCLGMGAIGSAAAQSILSTPGLDLAGAVDPARAEEAVGKITIVATPDELDWEKVDVALIATGSSLRVVESQITDVLRRGASIVSTCEELCYPWLKWPEVAGRLDEAAREEGGTILSCGVNPGFTMDLLPVVLAGASLEPESIRVQRAVNLGRRRVQLREKMGVGMNEGEWGSKSEGLGHTGLEESAYLCAAGMGWHIDHMDFTRNPVVRAGLVQGVHEEALASTADGRTIHLDLTFGLDVEDMDRIIIQGSPSLEALFRRGIHGDTATVARALHAAQVVRTMSPGLRLPTDMPAAISRGDHGSRSSWSGH